MIKRKNEKGVALYLAVVVMLVVLAVVVGISAILAKQLKTIRGLDYSVKALYAADSGLERVLLDIMNFMGNPGNLRDSYGPYNFDADTSFEIKVYCCPIGGTCTWTAANPCPLLAANPSATDPACNGYYFCATSVGNHKGVKRAVKIEI